MGVEDSPSNIKFNRNEDNNNVSVGNAAVYDIICYYKEENEENNDTVHAVIENIEKSSHKRRVLKNKWLKFRLFGCMLIIILLSSPVYCYVTLYLHHRDVVEDQNVVLIWAPIIFNAVYFVVTPWLISDSILSSLSNRTVILLFTCILSLAISASGFVFIFFDDKFFPLVIALYGVIGGKRVLSKIITL
jgi:hypothetical protein